MKLGLTKLALLLLITCSVWPVVGKAQAGTTADDEQASHPTMTAFLTELGSGELERAAGRIATVNDFFGLQRHYLYFTQAELVELLRSCKLVSHVSVPRRPVIAIEKTAWKCPDGKRYSMIFNSAGEAPNPYLYAHRIETDEIRKDREAEVTKKFASGQLPPTRLSMAATPQEVADFRERKRLNELEAFQKRDQLGEAVLSGDLDRITDLLTDETDVSYIIHDLFFDVKIKHINGVGRSDVEKVLRRAIAELGQPISVACRRREGRWGPQICEWELPNPDNAMIAEMNFAGDGGSLSSIRVFRKTPEETEALRQQAIELGIIDG